MNEEITGSEHLLLSDDKIFYTIEGEGEYVGLPSVFMRLSLCNLTCIGFKTFDSPHGCDSFVSWSVKNKMTFDEILDFLEDSGYKQHLFNGAIFKLTGGEPMVQQKQLLRFIEYMNLKWGWVPRIDFESNATLLPSDDWISKYSATFTTSPKLSNNGDPLKKRYVPEVIEWHAQNGSGFKFVVSDEKNVKEIFDNYIEEFDIPLSRVWFMPCCGSRDEHIREAPIVAELAKKYYVNFSPRLQLVIYDKALKV